MNTSEAQDPQMPTGAHNEPGVRPTNIEAHAPAQSSQQYNLLSVEMLSTASLLRYILQRSGGFCEVRLLLYVITILYVVYSNIKQLRFLKCFRHAKRSTVSPEDVKLVARRSTALVSYICLIIRSITSIIH